MYHVIKQRLGHQVTPTVQYRNYNDIMQMSLAFILTSDPYLSDLVAKINKERCWSVCARLSLWCSVKPKHIND